MKKAFRYLLSLYVMPVALLSAVALGCVWQCAMNYYERADMRRCVLAVREFQGRNASLPTQLELDDIVQTLPFLQDSRRVYSIATKPNLNDARCPGPWPKTGGWSLSYWGGDRTEYYSSWDDHYTVTDDFSVGSCLGIVVGVSLLFGAVCLICYYLRAEGQTVKNLAFIQDPFQVNPFAMAKEIAGGLRATIERPLYNLWRACMVVPLCFAVAFWVIIFMICGGDEINFRSWCLLAGGCCAAVLSVLVSRRAGVKVKLQYVGLTVLAYPMLFAAAMVVGFFLALFCPHA